MLAYYVHNISPFIFQIRGYGPRWYGFAYLMGFVVAFLLLRKLAKDKILRIPVERVPDLVLNCAIFGVLLGGRLGYAVFYEPKLLVSFSDHFPFWGFLEVWRGGMSAHGGIIGVIITIVIFARRNRYSMLNIGDAACMVVPLGLLFGRIANFINGELYGHPSTVPWAVKFPSEITAPTNGVMDSQVAERLPDAVAQVNSALHWGYNVGTVQGFDEARHQMYQALAQHNQQVVDLVANILPARHPSQLYEALLEGLALFLICWTVGRLWRKDGMAGGAFLTFYPIMRIIGEQFRVGDTPENIWGMNLSLGILYSIPVFFIGLGFWIVLALRKPPKPEEAPKQRRRPLM